MMAPTILAVQRTMSHTHRRPKVNGEENFPEDAAATNCTASTTPPQPSEQILPAYHSDITGLKIVSANNSALTSTSDKFVNLQQNNRVDMSHLEESIKDKVSSNTSPAGSDTLGHNMVLRYMPSLRMRARIKLTLLRAVKLSESKVIEHFRPRLFKQIDRKQKSLKLDLFWPVPVEKGNESGDACVVDDNDSEDDTCSRHAFPCDELKPLGTFRHLRVLHVTGMMHSYQPLIWQAVWANENLAVLQLEMVLAPMFNAASTHPNRVIGPNWSIFPSITPRPSMSSSESSSVVARGVEEHAYLGDKGSGFLNASLGSGEYLDSVAIKNALVSAKDEELLSANYHRFLSVQELTLMNFVVDGIAFEDWFDPRRLRKISFKGSCIDAGFYLHDSMKSLTLEVPELASDSTGVANAVRGSDLALARCTMPSASGLKILTIKDSKISSRIDVNTGKQDRPTGTAEKQKISPSSKLRGVRDAIKEKLGRGKENKSKDEAQVEGLEIWNDSSSSVVKVSPTSGSGAGIGGCFGGGFQSLESLFSAAEIREARNAKCPAKEEE